MEPGDLSFARMLITALLGLALCSCSGTKPVHSQPQTAASSADTEICVGTTCQCEAD